MPDVHANYRADTCTEMVETSREKLEMGFHGHEVSVRQVEDISPSKASPSYGKVREHRPGAPGAACHKAGRRR